MNNDCLTSNNCQTSTANSKWHQGTDIKDILADRLIGWSNNKIMIKSRSSIKFDLIYYQIEITSHKLIKTRFHGPKPYRAARMPVCCQSLERLTRTWIMNLRSGNHTSLKVWLLEHRWTAWHWHELSRTYKFKLEHLLLVMTYDHKTLFPTITCHI